jgi:hypothetical protein
LVLVGDGHDHANLVARAEKTPFANRIYFAGEANHGDLVNWYSHADVFVYTSLSETFGNVVNESLWCGLPVVALDDQMGVSHQIVHGVNGLLVQPGCAQTDDEYASACLRLLANRTLRRRLGAEAASFSRRTSHPDVILRRFERIYGDARGHCQREIERPLSHASFLARYGFLANCVAYWTFWNGMLLTMGHTTASLGASRKGGALQHVAVLAGRQTAQRRAADDARVAA